MPSSFMQSMLRIHAMSGYEILYECYLTGQMSERQLQAHLDDRRSVPSLVRETLTHEGGGLCRK